MTGKNGLNLKLTNVFHSSEMIGLGINECAKSLFMLDTIRRQRLEKI